MDMKSLLQFVKGLLMALLALSLVACSSGKPPQAVIKVQAANYLNPDLNGSAKPVVITLYQLKIPYSFQQADFDVLYMNSSQVLAGDLLDKQTLEARPGETMDITQSLNDGTAYLGFVAAYRNIEGAKWKEVLQLPHKKKIKIKLNLQAQGIAAQLN